MKPDKRELKKLYDSILATKPVKADVIIWLQGDRYERASKVLKLFKQGYAKKILISGNNVLIGPRARPGENNISLERMKEFLLKKGLNKKDIIVDDKSMNTKDQAEQVFKLAKKRSWLRLILVGSSYYQPRAFLTFLKQSERMKWPGRIINQPALIPWDKKLAGGDKSAKIIFNQELAKIKKYIKDLATVAQGLKYLN